MAMWQENWKTDWRFKKWLKEEKLNTDESPLDDNMLKLIHYAWRSGCQYGECGETERRSQYKVNSLNDQWP